MTDPVQPKTRKRPGPKPRKATDAALAIRDIYQIAPGARELIRNVTVGVNSLMPGPLLTRAIELRDDLDDEATALLADLMDVIDKRSKE